MENLQSHRSLKERQREQRENLILQIAEEVLLEKGYYETSVEEIAARVGVAKGTVYLHFPSKEDLVIAIFAREVEKFAQAIDSAIDSEQDVRAKLEAILLFMYSGHYSKRAQLLYSITGSTNLLRIFFEPGSTLHELWKGLSKRIEGLLEEGKSNGVLKAAIPTNVMLSAFFSLQSPRSYERLVLSEHMSPQEIVQYLGQIFFEGAGT
jgi:TetR/AcrR family transcriptional regulator, fatty acid metabolism regulator protein